MSQSTDTTAATLSLQQIALLLEQNKELMTVNDGLNQSIASLNQTQKTLSGRLRELHESSKSLTEANTKQQTLLTKKDKLIASLQDTLEQQPQSALAPSMTAHDEQELLDLLKNKNNLIRQQQAIIEERDTTIESLRALINELDS